MGNVYKAVFLLFQGFFDLLVFLLLFVPKIYEFYHECYQVLPLFRKLLRSDQPLDIEFRELKDLKQLLVENEDGQAERYRLVYFLDELGVHFGSLFSLLQLLF